MMKPRFRIKALLSLPALLTALPAAGSVLLVPYSGIPEEQDTTVSVRTLEESVVASFRPDGAIRDMAADVNVVTSLDAKKSVATTAADVLSREPGLSKGGDGVWATNIHVRGFGEDRLVTLVDRVRVAVATEHTTSLSMLDVNDIERIEVVKGAQSSIYGTGAVGGIINVITKDGHFANEPYFGGRFTANYASANNGHGEYLSLQGGGRKWYVRASGSFYGAGDIRTPQGYLPNSAYKSANAALKAGFKPKENRVLKLNFQQSHSWDVGVPGGAAFSPQATATFKNADRTLASLSYGMTAITESLSNLDFKVFYQGIRLDVEMQPNAPKPQTGARPVLVTPGATHRTFGARAESRWDPAGWNNLRAGAEIWQRRISSYRYKYIDKYSDGEPVSQVVLNETPLPDASYTSAGIFVQDAMNFLDGRLLLDLGARADVNHVSNSSCATFPEGSRTDPSWSANAGLLFKACRECDLTLNVSRSYRSPALEELFKFIDLSGNKVHYGNPSLKPEKGLGADLGVRARSDGFEFHLSAYVNGIRDMIVERRMNVEAESVNDTLVLQNAGRALLYGFDFSISYEIIKGLKVYASGDWTIGREISDNWNWLPGIPPLNARAGISYDNMKILGASFECVAAGARKDGQIASGERATQGWYRLDFAIHSRIFTFGRCALQLFAGVDNITNQTYTNFLATNRGNIICEPGRNFFIRANFTF
ncbi:MAG: TonB-dependent receptor [Bacteroidales bacterium]|nr:TonB-dependent receptor [Bacteroidales bacterium]